MQHLRHHGIPIQSWSLSYSNRGYQINRSETPSTESGSKYAMEYTTLLACELPLPLRHAGLLASL